MGDVIDVYEYFWVSMGVSVSLGVYECLEVLWRFMGIYVFL